MYDLLAALSFLPLKPVPWAFGDQRSKHANRRGLSMTTMVLLDALAALAVSEPDDVYAMAVTLPPQPLTLYVSATTVVPATAATHLRSIWSFLRTAYESVSRPEEPGPPPDSIIQAFITSQMRYSWGALRGRVQVDGETIITALTTTLSQLGANPPTATPAPQDSGRLPTRKERLEATMREPLNQLLQNVKSFQEGVLASDVLKDSVPFRAFYEICKLYTSVFGPAVEKSFVSDLDFLTGAPLSRLLARILWLAEPCLHLRRFSLSTKLGNIVLHPFDVVLVPPVTQQVQVGSLDKDLLLKAVVGTSISHKIRASRKDFLETHVFDRVEIILQGDQDKDDPTSDVSGAFNVPLHPELAVLAHLDSLPHAPYSYIGMSEPACLLCHEFITAYTEDSLRGQAFLRGSDCRISFPWVPPSLHGNHGARVMRNFEEIVSAMFASACSQKLHAQSDGGHCDCDCDKRTERQQDDFPRFPKNFDDMYEAFSKLSFEDMPANPTTDDDV